MLNLFTGDSTKAPAPSCRDSSTPTHRSGSAPTPATPSVDVQICINDVTVVDDVSVASDSDSCRSSEAVARRQRRRGSWCPEHSDDVEKQRRLSVTGRRFDFIVLNLRKWFWNLRLILYICAPWFSSETLALYKSLASCLHVRVFFLNDIR